MHFITQHINTHLRCNHDNMYKAPTNVKAFSTACGHSRYLHSQKHWWFCISCMFARHTTPHEHEGNCARVWLHVRFRHRQQPILCMIFFLLIGQHMHAPALDLVPVFGFSRGNAEYLTDFVLLPVA